MASKVDIVERIATTPISKRPQVLRGILCKDGAVVSVQASKAHYCGPRNDEGPWRTLCVYSEVNRRWKERGWVTKETVRRILAGHGGAIGWGPSHDKDEPEHPFYQTF